MHIELLRNSEFRENQHTEDHTILTGINEITYTRIPTFLSAYPLTPATLPTFITSLWCGNIS